MPQTNRRVSANQFKTIAPWVLSVVLAIWLAVNWQQSRVALEQKDTDLQKSRAALAQEDADLQNLRQQYDKLYTEANAKVKQLAEGTQKLAEDARKQIALANEREVQVRVGFRKAMLKQR